MIAVVEIKEMIYDFAPRSATLFTMHNNQNLPSSYEGVFCKPESSARCYFYLSSIRCSDRTPAAVCGFVQDASRVRIAAAKVEAQLAGTAQTRRVSSDSRGEFSIEELTPGSWHVPSMRLASQLLGRIYP
ncbi:carboxypeptidase-like regulatory domain-containing protein [Tunturiibacter empetritectus]|uniref:carboxypeptidase-like regulatory domain-containing protein n=1 Tax=Tunturiibacter empetritectus TaxID=3069691 RepID=UPI003D9B0DBC